MKVIKAWIVILIAVFAGMGCEQTADPNRTLLPENFKVYTDGQVVINHPVAKFSERILPTNSDYRDYPGCYMACYSKIVKHSAYPAGGGIYVHGQVRVPGEYQQQICVPKDRNPDAIKKLCQEKIKSCDKGDCWGGGDTGGWYGIQ